MPSMMNMNDAENAASRSKKPKVAVVMIGLSVYQYLVHYSTLHVYAYR